MILKVVFLFQSIRFLTALMFVYDMNIKKHMKTLLDIIKAFRFDKWLHYPMVWILRLFWSICFCMNASLNIFTKVFLLLTSSYELIQKLNLNLNEKEKFEKEQALKRRKLERFVYCLNHCFESSFKFRERRERKPFI